MIPPEAACGRLPPEGDTSGPAKRLRFGEGSYRASHVMPELKRLRFSEGSHRASDVMPELKPVPRSLLDNVLLRVASCLVH